MPLALKLVVDQARVLALALRGLAGTSEHHHVSPADLDGWGGACVRSVDNPQPAAGPLRNRKSVSKKIRPPPTTGSITTEFRAASRNLIEASPQSEVSPVGVSDLAKLGLFQGIFALARALVGVFIPVVLWSEGFSMTSILGYAMIAPLSMLAVGPAVVALVARVGFTVTVLISLPLYFAQVGLIHFVPDVSFLLVLAGVLSGMHLSTFWIPINAVLSLTGTRKNRGTEIGKLTIMTSLGSMMAPVLAGLVLHYFSYGTLVVFVFVLVAASWAVLCTAASPHIRPGRLRYRHYASFLTRGSIGTRLSYLAFGADSVLAVFIWPVCVFVLVSGHFGATGTVFSVSSAAALAFVYATKERLNVQTQRDQANALTTSAVAGIYIVKAASCYLGPIAAVGASAADEMTRSVFTVANRSIFLNLAQQDGDAFEYVLYRDLLTRIGRIVMCIVCLAVLVLAGESEGVIFALLLLGVPTALLQILLKEGAP